jgi:hypothetical protein
MRAQAIPRLLVLCAIFPALTSVHGQLIVSNIDQTTGTGANVGSDAWFAQQFLTPSDSEYSMTSMSLKLKYELSNTGTYSVALWTTTGNKPGKLFAPIATDSSLNSLTTSFANYNFTLASPVTLDKNASYFLVVNGNQSTSERGLVWGDTLVLNPPGNLGPGQIGGWTQSNDSGTSWDPVFFGNNFEIAVMGTPVPEPQYSAIAASFALIAFVALRQMQSSRRLKGA